MEMIGLLSGYRHIFSRKIVFTLLGGICVVGAILLLIMLLLIPFTINKLIVTRTPIVIEGTIQIGSEENLLTVINFVKTPRGISYYLVDKTDEISRKQKADPKYCPTDGTIHCYLGRRVRIKGFVTNRQKIIETFEKDRLQTYELEVLSFEVLANP